MGNSPRNMKLAQSRRACSIPDDVKGYLALHVEVRLLVVLADELVVVDGLAQTSFF